MYCLYFILVAVCNPECINGGSCDYPDECNCTEGWSGRLCDKRKYKLWKCMNTCWLDSLRITPHAAVCDPECSNHGDCVRPNECSCHDGWEGPTCDNGKP